MTLPSSLVPKKNSKHTLYDVTVTSLVTSCQKHENHQKSWFFAIMKQKLHFLAMMCVKVCLHMFLLQINQINKIKHSGSVSWKTKRQKTRFVCNFNGKSVFQLFSLYPARYYTTLRHNPRSDFYKNGLKSSARLEGKKSRSFSAKK